MALRFAYSRPDGGVDIVQAMSMDDLIKVVGVPDELGRLTLSDESYRTHVLERSIPAYATDVIELSEDWIEPDRNYRNAWVIKDGQIVVDPVKQAALMIPLFQNAIQKHVDDTAMSKGYADGVALAGYSTSTIPDWSQEAQTFIAWRDQVWLYAYTELAKVQGGQREAPTVEGFISELPSILWP